jgi:hypothetical protein
VPLDPGERALRFEMEGASTIERKVLIHQGEKDRTILAAFQKLPPPPPPPPTPPLPPPLPLPGAVTSPPPDTAAPEPTEGHKGGVPVWAWVTGAGGLALLGVGAGFGVAALDAQSELVTKCGGNPSLCPASTSAVTVPLANRRTLDRDVFIGLGLAGVAAIGAAVAGIVRAPGKAAGAPSSFVVTPFILGNARERSPTFLGDAWARPSGGGVTMGGPF